MLRIIAALAVASVAVAHPIHPLLPEIPHYSVLTPSDPPLQTGQQIIPEVNRPPEHDADAPADAQEQPERNQTPPDTRTTIIINITAPDEKKQSGNQADGSQPEGIESFIIGGYKFKITDFLVALFTGFLVIVGWVQARRLRQTVIATRTAAEALPVLERAYLFFQIDPTIGLLIRNIIDGYQARREQMPASMPSETLVRYQFVNHGKTPAILQSIAGQFVISTELPRPITHDDDPAVLNIVIPSGGIFPSPLSQRVPEIRSRNEPSQYREVVYEFQGRCSLTGPEGAGHHITDEESVQLQTDNIFLWFYGRLIYEDIFGRVHETRFCWRYNAGYGTYDQDGVEDNYRT